MNINANNLKEKNIHVCKMSWYADKTATNTKR